MVLPPFLFGGNAQSPQIFNELSGLYRPTATNLDIDRLYQTGVAAYTAANKRAENVGAVRWRLVDASGQLVDNPLTDLLLSTSMSDTMMRVEISLCFRGRALIWLQPNRFTQAIARLRYINFNLYNLRRDSVRGLVGFNVYSSSTVSEPIQRDFIPIEETLYFHLVDLFDDFDGVSPAEVCFMSAGVDVESATTALAYFQNMAIPALMFQPPEDANVAPTPQEVKDFGDLLRRVAKGAVNAGRNIISPHRWDVKDLQPNFHELDMTGMRNDAQEAVFMAFQVPIEIVKPTESNYAQAREARRSWIRTWLEPHCAWYAEQITEQMIRPLAYFDPRYATYRIIADFTNVPDHKEDDARRVEIANAKVSGGYLDLYNAALMTGTEADPRLRGLYRVGTNVVPIEAMSTLYQTQQQSSSPFGGGSANPGALPKLKISSDTAEPAAKALPPGADVWLPDGMYQEWRNWRNIVGRKGKDYPFTAQSLPTQSVDFGKLLLAENYDIDEAFTAIRAHALIALKTVKPSAVFATPEEYEHYWKHYDALKADIREAWLHGYMAKAGAEVAKRYKRLGILPADEEIGHALSTYHAALIKGWIGTHDEPGPLLAIALAGLVAGDYALETGKPASAKALDMGMVINWSLMSQEALDFVAKYAFNLIRNIDQTTVEAVRSIETDSISQGLSRDETAKQLDQIFHDQARSKLIAQTEGIRLYNRGAMSRWSAAGVNRAKWKTVNDGNVCPVCARLAEQEADIATGWRDPQTGKSYIDSGHPGCRCFRQPIAV